jgi:hypothetical protein
LPRSGSRVRAPSPAPELAKSNQSNRDTCAGCRRFLNQRALDLNPHSISEPFSIAEPVVRFSKKLGANSGHSVANFENGRAYA